MRTWSATILATVAVSLALGLAAPGPALASCVTPKPLSQTLSEPASASRGVFVGVVTKTSWGGRRASVEVTDVWRGEVPDHTTVVGTPGGATAMTSVDRSYVVGTEYLFVPWGRRRGTWQDNACSGTRAYTSALAAQRPSSAHLVRGTATPAAPPSSAATTQTSPPRDEGGRGASWGLIGAAVVIAAAGGLQWRRKRSQRGGVRS